MPRFTYSRLSRSKSALFLRQGIWQQFRPLSTAQFEKQFRINVTAIVPPLLSGGIQEAPNLRIIARKIPVKISATTESLPDAEGMVSMVSASLNQLNIPKIDSEWIPNIDEVLTKGLSELKDAFSATLVAGASEWSPVSNERLARRAAMAELGTPNQLSTDPTVHYTNRVFEQCINSFSSKTTKDSATGKLTLEISTSVPPNAYHPDFAGLRSGWKGPNEIMMSIMGLHTTNNPGRTTSGKKMIVPIGTSESNLFTNKYERGVYRLKKQHEDGRTFSYTKKYDAAISSSSYRLFTYPSKSNPFPKGVPVVFLDQIRSGNVYFQDIDSDKKRPVFWYKSKEEGGKIGFPRRVKEVLQKYKFVGEAIR